MNSTWGTTRTGMVFHSFKTDGTAVCRGNIKAPAGVELITGGQVDARLAEAWGARVRGLRKCDSCGELEAAAQARLEASLAPSDGEGDHLPPAETVSAAHHYNALGGQRWIAGRGWVNHCRVCQAPEGSGDHFHNLETEEQPMKPGRRATGPLTDRQEQVIDHLIAGERQRSTALIMKRSESYISAELTLAVHKLKARTAVQACSFVATSRAYREAADLLDKSSRAHPQQDGVAEDHVNHVLMSLANELRARADKLLPR